MIDINKQIILWIVILCVLKTCDMLSTVNFVEIRNEGINMETNRITDGL